MALSEPLTENRFFTPAEANAMLPLVRSIVRDIAELSRDLRDRHERLTQLGAGQERPDAFADSYREERQAAQRELEQDQARLDAYVDELHELGVALKDFFVGLVDFPSRREGRPVWLCWKLGEPRVAFWHEIDAGAAGRQPLDPESNA
jgi:hypothetical protein